MKCKNDIIFWDAHTDQLRSNIIFRAVMLNPDLSLFNVKVQGASVNTPVSGPAHGENLIMIMFGVLNQLHFKIVTGRFP